MELYNFLVESKKQTYANENVERVSPTRKGSYDYEYKNDNMIYHDTYFGGTNFIGEEVVYSTDNTPIWGMNYYGITLNENLSEEIFNRVLRPALMQVGVDKNVIPIRGPKEYTNNEYRYTFQVDGDLNYFEGIETIFKNDEKIYILKCHGGIIKK